MISYVPSAKTIKTYILRKQLTSNKMDESYKFNKGVHTPHDIIKELFYSTHNKTQLELVVASIYHQFPDQAP